MNRQGNIVLTDTNTNRVQEISPSGTVVAIWTNLHGKLNQPSAGATDRAGTLYVADTGTSRVIKVSPGGHALHVFR